MDLFFFCDQQKHNLLQYSYFLEQPIQQNTLLQCSYFLAQLIQPILTVMQLFSCAAHTARGLHCGRPRPGCAWRRYSETGGRRSCPPGWVES